MNRKTYQAPTLATSTIIVPTIICASNMSLMNGSASDSYDQLSKERDAGEETVSDGWTDGLW